MTDLPEIQIDPDRPVDVEAVMRQIRAYIVARRNMAGPTTDVELPPFDGRLDAAQQRVTALITAVDTVRPAVRDFYASLTDEQKAALSIQPGEKQTANNRG